MKPAVERHFPNPSHTSRDTYRAPSSEIGRSGNEGQLRTLTRREIEVS